MTGLEGLLCARRAEIKLSYGNTNKNRDGGRSSDCSTRFAAND